MPLVPIPAVLDCAFLMLNLPLVTWLRFGVWMALGIAVYFLYGYRKSRLAEGKDGSAGGHAALATLREWSVVEGGGWRRSSA